MARNYKKLRRKIKVDRNRHKYTTKYKKHIVLTPAAVSAIIKACSMPVYEKEKVYRAMKELEQN